MRPDKTLFFHILSKPLGNLHEICFSKVSLHLSVQRSILSTGMSARASACLQHNSQCQSPVINWGFPSDSCWSHQTQMLILNMLGLFSCSFGRVYHKRKLICYNEQCTFSLDWRCFILFLKTSFNISVALEPRGLRLTSPTWCMGGIEAKERSKPHWTFSCHI